MSRPKTRKTTDLPLQRPELRAKVHIWRDTLGPGKMQLLKLIGQTGSISAAAREMGIGYRRAWLLLESLQACFQEPLISTTRGGGGTGGAKLTATGAELAAQYTQMLGQIDQAAEPFLDWLNSRQSRVDAP